MLFWNADCAAALLAATAEESAGSLRSVNMKRSAGDRTELVVARSDSVAVILANVAGPRPTRRDS